MIPLIQVIIAGIVLISTMFGIYLKVRIDLTKLDMRINAINRELLQKEIALLLSERLNREDHEKIVAKLDHLIEIYSKK